jgi:hypothetical protein
MYTEGRNHARCCQSKLWLDYSIPGHNEGKSTKLRDQKTKHQSTKRGESLHLDFGRPHCHLQRSRGDSFIRAKAPATDQNKCIPKEVQPAARSPCPLVFVLQGYLGGGPLFSACFALALKDSKQILVRCQE